MSKKLPPQQNRPAVSLPSSISVTGGSDCERNLFDACKNGDILAVKSIADSSNVLTTDGAGRRSTPLHFAAGDV